MVPAVLQPYVDSFPWALVLVIYTPMAIFALMFVVALLLVEKSRRVEAIKEMAEMARAILPGRRR